MAQPEDVGEVQGGLLEIAITRIEEKKSFDEAQAIELSNVLNSAAVRGLSQSELAEVDFGKVMNMRWVMTWKATGQAKARLVVLGYQAHNLTSVATASPTLRAGPAGMFC